MNTKSLIITIVVAFITVWATDFLIHALWLGSTYKATQHLWRPEAEMVSKLPFMFAGQFLVAAAFTMIFAACVAEKRCLSCSLKFAGCMGVLVAAGQIIMYAVAPYPGSLVAKWCVAYLLQALVLGVVLHKVYKPLPAKSSA
jgi:hypothetical protein